MVGGLKSDDACPKEHCEQRDRHGVLNEIFYIMYMQQFVTKVRLSESIGLNMIKNITLLAMITKGFQTRVTTHDNCSEDAQKSLLVTCERLRLCRKACSSSQLSLK